jgi:hypothetical protein
MFIFLLYIFPSLNEGHSLSKEEKSYNSIEFWDRLLVEYLISSLKYAL